MQLMSIYAESWLISQDLPLIEATTSGPDIEGVSVVCESEQPEIPKKKKVIAAKPKVPDDGW